MTLLPMPLIDDFLINYNVGQVLILVFAFAVLGVVAKYKSRKMLAGSVIAFGLLFLLTPAMVAPLHYKFLGLALLVVGPMIYTTAES